MKLLFIDIETAPALAYIWDLRTRYVPLSQVAEDGYILCFAASWEGEAHIDFWSEWDHGHHSMIEAAFKLLDEADAVVHYNGKKFDIPRLNVEFLKLGMGVPSPYAQIDLYTTVQSNFKVLSKSMNHMLNILGLEEKIKHKGMELWTGCMDYNPVDLKLMEEYNIQDVEVLEQLYEELRPWVRGHPNRAVFLDPVTGDEKRSCPTCGSTELRFKGYQRTRAYAYKQYLCKSCGTYSRERFADESTKERKDILL